MSELFIGYWVLVIGYWLLAIGYWLLAIGYWLLAIVEIQRLKQYATLSPPTVFSPIIYIMLSNPSRKYADL
jgi:hypothetical protein